MRLRREERVSAGSALGIAAIVAVIPLLVATGFTMARSIETRARCIESIAESMGPEKLAELVEHTSLIVVGRYALAQDLGEVTLMTPEPVSSGIAPPGLTVGPGGVRIDVDRVLKSDGQAMATVPFTYTVYGTVPQSRQERDDERWSPSPLLWPEGTEFVLFLDQEPGADDYYVQYGSSGRILTSGGGQVRDSDCERTVQHYMRGMDRDDLIEAVLAEVADPSPTEWP